MQGDVEKLDFVKNKDQVRVYIKFDSLGKEFYIKKFKSRLTKEKVKNAPLFSFEVLDWKAFDESLVKIYTTQGVPLEVRRDIVKDPEWLALC